MLERSQELTAFLLHVADGWVPASFRYTSGTTGDPKVGTAACGALPGCSPSLSRRELSCRAGRAPHFRSCTSDAIHRLLLPASLPCSCACCAGAHQPTPCSTSNHSTSGSSHLQGVLITHKAVVATCAGIYDFLEVVGAKLGCEDVMLSYLPLAHIFDRWVHTCGSEMLLDGAANWGFEVTARCSNPPWHTLWTGGVVRMHRRLRDGCSQGLHTVFVR